MRNSYLVFGQPLIEEAEIDEVVRSLRAAWLGTGPKVAEFEKRIASYKTSPHAVAVNSCTAGLHLACLTLQLGPGDEVIVPAMTFAATVNCVVHAGATPVLVDVEPDTFNIDPEQVRRAITPRTKAIMPVHFAGRACNMDALLSLAQQHGLKIIEDCAHAIETEYRGRKAGTIGDCEKIRSRVCRFACSASAARCTGGISVRACIIAPSRFTPYISGCSDGHQVITRSPTRQSVAAIQDLWSVTAKRRCHRTT